MICHAVKCSALLNLIFLIFLERIELVSETVMYIAVIMNTNSEGYKNKNDIVEPLALEFF
jgi:hypothetical protein